LNRELIEVGGGIYTTGGHSFIVVLCLNFWVSGVGFQVSGKGDLPAKHDDTAMIRLCSSLLPGLQQNTSLTFLAILS